MDPNTALATIRTLCTPNGQTGDVEYDLHLLIEAFDALDDWLSKGGFLPADWAKMDRGEQLGAADLLGIDPERQETEVKVDLAGDTRFTDYHTQADAIKADRERAMATGEAVTVATQGENSVTRAQLALSDSVGQDADTVITVVTDEADDSKPGEMVTHMYLLSTSANGNGITTPRGVYVAKSDAKDAGSQLYPSGQPRGMWKADTDGVGNRIWSKRVDTATDVIYLIITKLPLSPTGFFTPATKRDR